MILIQINVHGQRRFEHCVFELTDPNCAVVHYAFMLIFRLISLKVAYANSKQRHFLEFIRSRVDSIVKVDAGAAEANAEMAA